MKKNLPALLASVYIFICMAAYFLVFMGPPDGLANTPLVVVHLPSIIAERVSTQVIFGSMDGYLWKPLVEFAGLPKGYKADHICWFLPLTIFQTYAIYFLGKIFKKN